MFSFSLRVIRDGAKPGRESPSALSPFRLFSNLFHLAHNSGVLRVRVTTKRDHPSLSLC
ncbi:hypothetical protein PIB30_104686, partial [Stylosanthes scabra]|nr:hypothetical protein [Stylosanthes scabra]